MAELEESRIGIFVCHCGINIGNVVDVPAVIEYASKLPGVIHAERNLYTCSEDSLAKIRDTISKEKLNRVIVASCTPRTHEPLFRSICEEAGLNPYLFEFVNIREQCSWVHQKMAEAATEKAKDLIRMATARAMLLEPQIEKEIDVTDQAMVIGGGMAGIQASLSLANQDFVVYLVEREKELGGILLRLHKVAPTGALSADVLKTKLKAVKSNKNIKVMTSAVLKKVEGYIGNFDVTLELKDKKEQIKFKVGTIIIATGAVEREPSGLFGYGQYPNVITQLQLEEKLKDGIVKAPRKIIMIQCAGARDIEVIPYCSRICCSIAVKNALELKELYPKAEIHILHRGIQTYGVEYESLYRQALASGIKFIRLLEGRPPQVTEKSDRKLEVKAYDAPRGEEMLLSADLVVLSSPLVQHSDGEDLAKMLRVPLGSDRFFLEAHVKLRPVDFATDGIYVCGTAHGPKGIIDSISQAYATASRAAIPMANRKVRAEAITARVDETACISCGLCEFACAYSAVKLVKNEDGKWVSTVNDVMCKGCGVCASCCPALAITMRHYTKEQILAQIKTAFVEPLEKEIEPRILAFTCNWCSYAGADLAGVSRIQYPPNVRIIRLMCSGRVDPMFVFEAFRNGADGVLISGCHPGDCHYISGNKWTEARFEVLKNLLSEINIEPNRFRLAWVSASEGKKFAETITEMVEDLKKLGPIKLSA